MTSMGLAALYNNTLQGGRGGMTKIGNLNTMAKDRKVISKLGGVSDALGTTAYLDRGTKGLFSKGVSMGKKKGYGKKKGKKGKGKK